jgi:hypothetical protein
MNNMNKNNIIKQKLPKFKCEFYTQPFQQWSLGKCSISYGTNYAGVPNCSVSSSYYVILYQNSEATIPIGYSYHSTNVYGEAENSSSNNIYKLTGKESVTYVIDNFVTNNNNITNKKKYGFVSENVLLMVLSTPLNINTQTTVSTIDINMISSYQTNFPLVYSNGETSIAFQKYMNGNELPEISLSSIGYLTKRISDEAENRNTPLKKIINLTDVIQVYRWNNKNM